MKKPIEVRKHCPQPADPCRQTSWADCMVKRCAGQVRLSLLCELPRDPCCESSCKEKLKEARDAHHKMLVGKHAVSLAVDGRSTTFAYNSEQLAKLEAYIMKLEEECGEQPGKKVCVCGGDGCVYCHWEGAAPRRRGAMSICYG